jgi:hypothetical protein
MRSASSTSRAPELATFWVNRLGVAPEQLIEADATGPDLEHLARWVSAQAVVGG